MKKKFLLILILSLVILIPTTSNASTCTTCNQGGPIGGGVGNSSLGGKGGCGKGNCTWGVGGVRVSLYYYDGSGNPQKIGSSVDIYSQYHYYTRNMKISKPSSDSGVLNRRGSSCSLASNTFPNSYSVYSGDVWNQYLSENSVFQYNIYNTLKQGKIADWLYDTDSGTGWLEDNVFSKLRDTNYASVASLFKTTADNISTHLDEAYIVAELLTQIKVPGGDDLGANDLFYTGTVGEISSIVVYNNLINRLYVPKSLGAIGKLTGPNSNYYIEEVDKGFHENGGEGLFLTGVKSQLCNKTYGMGIWYLTTCCPDCVRSCSNECKDTGEGTTERRACAMKYCTEYESDNYNSCVSTCSTVDGSKGCDNGSGVCDTTDSIKTGSKCSMTGDTTLKTSVCYDDTSSYSVDSFNFTSYKQLSISYYKIDCDETAKIFSVISNARVLAKEGQTATLYLGYGVNYNKECKIKYKKRTYNNSTKKYEYTWTDEDQKGETEYSSSDMLIKKDIATYKQYYNDTKTSNSTLAQKYKEAYEQLENVYAASKNRLNVLSTDQNDVIKPVARVDIANSDSDGAISKEITLEPTYCEVGSPTSVTTTNSYKCSMIKSTLTVDEEGKIVCGSLAEMTNIDYKGSKTEYTVYYALPDSYVSSYTSSIKIYRDAKSCENAVKGANGLCIKKEDVWVFDPFTEVKEVNNDYELEYVKDGTCDLKFSCESEYSLTKSERCELCVKSDDYEGCYEEYCSCEAMCGTNVACLAKYCPEECEECDKSPENICVDLEEDECDECVNNCNSSTSLTSIENTKCRSDCCNANCENGVCQYECCLKSCRKMQCDNTLNEAGYTDYNDCSETCLKIITSDGDYYYRTIDQERPFPGTPGTTREPGVNWYKKVEYITESENAHSRYYDSTNGKNASYEYKVKLSSDDIKKIKNDDELNTTYTQKVSSTTMKNGDAYCSYIIHDYLKDININVEAGAEGYGSGCRK